MLEIKLSPNQIKLFEDFQENGPRSHIYLRTYVPIRPEHISDIVLPNLIHGVWRIQNLFVRAVLLVPALIADLYFLPVRLIMWVPSYLYNRLNNRHPFLTLIDCKGDHCTLLLDCVENAKLLFTAHAIALRALPYTPKQPKQPSQSKKCHEKARAAFQAKDYITAMRYAQIHPDGIMHKFHVKLKSMQSPPTQALKMSYTYLLNCALKGPDYDGVLQAYSALKALDPYFLHAKAQKICFKHWINQAEKATTLAATLCACDQAESYIQDATDENRLKQVRFMAHLNDAQSQTDLEKRLQACKNAASYIEKHPTLLALQNQTYWELACRAVDRPQEALKFLEQCDPSDLKVQAYLLMLTYQDIDYNERYDRFLDNLPQNLPEPFKQLAAKVCEKAGYHCYLYGPNNPNAKFTDYAKAIDFFTKASELNPTKQNQQLLNWCRFAQNEIEQPLEIVKLLLCLYHLLWIDRLIELCFRKIAQG